MAKTLKDKPLTLTVHEKVCDDLQCNIGDVVEKIPDQNEPEEGNKENGSK